LPVTKDSLLKAMEELKKTSVKRNFKQAVELIVKLRDVDLKKSESRISEQVEMPNNMGKPVKVCVIASGDLGVRAKKAGADLVIGREELDKLGKDKKAIRKLSREFDYFVAEAPLMPVIGKTIGSKLGPKGKMPTPVPPSAPIEDVLERHRRMVRLRVRDQPVIQCRVGIEDMPDEKIIENIQAVITKIEGKFERGSKNIGSIILKTSMGPPIKVM